MTRINTNVSSLNAQKSLARSNASLQTALTRLSTGLRINSGKDDPAGLIASEVLRSDIVSTQRAISNSERANQMIATADSALGQVSSLLNDIRALVTEAANTGAMSEEQIAANQLQVDSALEALNRISQVTNFQGRRLLDGSLDFIHDASSIATLSDLQIDQANLGETGEVAVSVDISAAATQAKITGSGVSAGTEANATLTFAAGATLEAAAGDLVDIVATELDSDYSGVTIKIVADDTLAANTDASASFDADTNTLSIGIKNEVGTAVTAATVAQAINDNVTEFQAVVNDDTLGDFAQGDIGVTTATTGAATLKVEMKAGLEGADYNGMEVKLATSATTPVDAPEVEYDSANNRLTITVSSGATDITTLANIESFIEAYAGGAMFDVDVTTAGNERLGIYGAAGADTEALANTGTTGGNTLLDELVMEVSGTSGTEVFTFESGTSINQIANALNLVADSTGVGASFTGGTTGTLTLLSNDYGEKAIVSVDVISEGSLGTFEAGLSAARKTGTDVKATINGVTVNGDGNSMSINTATLDLSLTVADGSSTDFQFTISGGGAQFQMGPDVVRNQQARLGIQSVNSARLRGATGRLYELGSGNDAALATDPTRAAKIVDEVITKVTALRGRLGAFQKTTLESNINSLNDTLENLVSAESNIRDADFAAETASLTRGQILVQSGTAVLSIANSNPQNVLALLR